MTPAAASALAVEIVATSEALARLEPEWRALARAAERGSCFAQPEYFQVWRRQLGGDVGSAALAVRAADGLRGVMPIMRAAVWRGPSCAPRHDFTPSDRTMVDNRRPRPIPVRQISPVVSMPATLVVPTPLCRDADTPAVARAMAGALLAERGWDVIVLPVYEGLEQESWRAAFESLGRRPRLHALGRVVQGIRDVRPFDGIVAAQNAKYRQNVRRARAAAVELGVTLAVQEGRAEVTARLPAFAEIARASWKHLGREGQQVTLPYEGRQRAFIEALLAEPESCLTPVLVTASAGGETIAALLAVRDGDVLTTLLTYRDDRCGAASPGLLILGRLIDLAAETGVRRIDLNATHDWVRHLVDERRAQDNLVVFSPTLRGRLCDRIARTFGSLQ